MNKPTTNVLILDANQRSSLAVARSLGAVTGVNVFTADSMEESIAGCSKFSRIYYKYPSISHSPNLFLNWVEEFLTEKHFDIIFPCTEISSQLLLMNTQVLGSTKLPFASFETVMSLADKGQLTKLAETINVRCPNSAFYHSASDVNLENIKDFPVVIKPFLSQLWRDHGWEQTMVTIAHNRQQLSDFLQNSPWLQNDPFMLQEFITGHGAGIFAIYDQGKEVAFFSHQRIREKPPQGGVSVLSKSSALDPALLENAKSLLDSVKWHGVAMVEFRVSEDGTPYLMEVNTRFWGSLQLAIDAGVDFPELLYKITLNEPVLPINEYNHNARLRWFLGDIDSLYLVLRSSKYSAKEKLLRIISFFTPHFFSTRHQVGRRGDWRPALAEFKQYINDMRK